MALLRLDPKKDASTGLYYLEIYYPADSEQPFVTTLPKYKTAAAAESDLIAIVSSKTMTGRNADSG
jgi:hypothetical protein